MTSSAGAPGLVPEPAPSRPDQRRLTALTWLGGALLLTGLSATMAAVLPPLTGIDPWPPWVYFLPLLAVVGFAVLLVGLFGAARTRR